MFRIPASLVLAVALVCPLAAQTVSYSDFLSTSGLTLNGSAVQSGANLSIIQTISQAGSAFYDQRLAVAAGFDTTFDFWVLPPTSGPSFADGFAFVIHDDPLADSYLGVNGGQLGYGMALTNSVVIEIDNYNNGNLGDVNGNHVAVHTAGPNANMAAAATRLAEAPAPATITDGMLHTLRVEYVPGTLKVYFDDLLNPLITVPWDFLAGGTLANGNAVMAPNLTQGAAFVGFTGGTGAIGEQVEILNWNWTSSFPNAPCYEGTVNAGGGTLFDVLTVNGSAGGFFRKVTLEAGEPFLLEFAQPPANPSPAPFALFGIIGVPDQTTVFPTPWGDLCFPPSFIFPAPWIFTMTDSLVMSPGVFPPSPTPWSLFAPFGIPSPVTVTFQGGCLEDNGNPNSVAISNAVILEIVPNPPPVLGTITPFNPQPGASVTISGSGFDQGVAVTAGATPLVLDSVSETAITFTAPSSYSCDTPVTIQNPDGQAAFGALNPSPVILNFPISQGSAAGGNTFVMTGQFFGAGSTVDFGGIQAVVLSSSNTLITGQVPAGVSGTSVTVTLTTPGGCSATTNYTYL